MGENTKALLKVKIGQSVVSNQKIKNNLLELVLDFLRVCKKYLMSRKYPITITF